MAENQYKKPEKQTKTGKGATQRFVQSLLDGSILDSKNMSGLLPFFIFITVLAFFLIFNTYYAEKQARQLEATRKEVVELRTRYISTKSELMYLTNQSEIARKLKPAGFVESTEPPQLVYKTRRKENILKRLLAGR